MNEELIDIFSKIEDKHWWFVGRRILIERTLKKYINNRNKKRKILDIGSGSGGNYDFFSGYGDVYGVDNSKTAIIHSKKKNYKKIVRASAVKLPFPSNSFDLVFLLDVLEHIENDAVALKEARRVLKKDGLIVVTAPAISYIWSKHDSMQGHFRRYSESELSSLSIKNHLEILENFYFNSFLFIPIAVIRIVSNLKMFSRLATYDSRINLDIAKLGPLNKILQSIFLLEINLNNYIKYPVGVSLMAVFRK